MGHCVFCGWEGTLTREHAWPKWIREVLPKGQVKGYSQQHRVAVGTGEVTAITPMMRHKAADREVKVVCQQECNGGWMSALEDVAKPLLIPLILGEAVDISEDDQRLIAFWATKTAMMLQFMHPVDLRGIPASHYGYVYEQREALPSMRVWLSAALDHFYRTSHYMRAYRLPVGPPRGLWAPQGEPTPPNAYTAVMVVGRMVLSLIGWTVPEWNFTLAPNDGWAPARRCIWPPRPGGWSGSPDAVLGSLVEIERFAAAATH